MSGASFKAANISFKKRIAFFCSIYVKKVMKLVALLVRGIVKQKCTDLENANINIKQYALGE